MLSLFHVLSSSNVFFYLAKPGYFSYKEVVFTVPRGRLNFYKGGQIVGVRLQCTSHRATGEAGVDGAAGAEGEEVPKSRGRSRHWRVWSSVEPGAGRWGGVA